MSDNTQTSEVVTPSTMSIKDFNEWKAKQKRTRLLNEETLMDLRQQVEHEKLIYELGNYRLMSIEDLITRSKLVDDYKKAQEILTNTIENSEK